MRMQSNNLEVQKSEGDDNSFTLEFNPFMASLLSDKMYSDKPLALWREHIANAIDATNKGEYHVKCGDPYDVNDLECYVQDFGVGLNKTDLMKYYIGYGSSNKRENNKGIGGFGIGSKVCFAYTSSYEVKSWGGGEYTHILCYKDEKGMPCARVYENRAMLPDERTGLKVSWELESRQDIVVFGEALQKAVSRHDVYPSKAILADKNVQYYFNKFKNKQDRYCLLTSEYGVQDSFFGKKGYSQESYIVMGGVAYPLNPGYLPSQLNNLDIFVPIGSVQVTGSREELSYDPMTKLYLEEVCNRVVLKISEGYIKRIQACTSIEDEYLTLEKVPYYLRSTIQETNLSKFTGKKIEGFYKFTDFLGMEDERSQWWRASQYKTLQLTLFKEYRYRVEKVDSSIFILCKDTNAFTGFKTRVKRFTDAEHPTLTTVIVVESVDRIKELKAEGFRLPLCVEWTEELNKKYTPPKKVRQASVKADGIVTTVRKLPYHTVVWSQSSHTKEDFKRMFETGGKINYYLPAEGGTQPIDPPSGVKHEDVKLVKEYLDSKGITVYAIAVSQASKLKKVRNWVCLHDVVDTLIKRVKKEYPNKEKVISLVKSQVPPVHTTHLLNINKTKYPSLHKLSAKLLGDWCANTGVSEDLVDSLCTFYSLDKEAIEDSVEASNKALWNRYPLLSYSRLYSHGIAAYEEYITLININNKDKV